MKIAKITASINQKLHGIEVEIPDDALLEYALAMGITTICNTVAVAVQNGDFIPDIQEINGHPSIVNGVQIKLEFKEA